MIRRIVVPGCAAALALTAWVGLPTAQAAPRGAECQLAGSASISPGLTQTAKTQRVTLSGVRLTGCRVGSSGAPSLPPTVTSATVSTSPNPVTTTASCAKGNLALTATIRWANGQTTTASVTTKGVAANQAISGKVTSSTNPSLQPADLVEGDVAFKPTTTAQNCVKVPVTAVTFTGVLAAGSPK
jgi:hypothetical protein